MTEPRKHVLWDVESFVAAVQHWGKVEDTVIFVDLNGAVAVLDDAGNRANTLELACITTTVWSTLHDDDCDFCDLNQAQMAHALRAFIDDGIDAKLIDDIVAFDFDEDASGDQRPLPLQTQVWAHVWDLNGPPGAEVRCALLVHHVARTFSLLPLPMQIEQAEDDAVAWLINELRAALTGWFILHGSVND